MADATFKAVELNEVERGERVEMMVDIYDSVDAVRRHDLRTQQLLQHTGSVSVKSRKQRAVEVCLCLLCALLLTAVIVFCVYFNIQRIHLLTHITNLTEEREQVLKHNNDLTKERDQILKHNNNLTEEKQQILNKYDQILKHNNNLTEEREQLKNKTIELQCGLNKQDLLSENFKWIYYNFNLYCISSEKKSWSDSRLDCQQRGADLVIIKSQKEYEFLQDAAVLGSFWIGKKKTAGGVWKWIDGTEKIWSSKLYSGWYGYDCALMASSGWRAGICMNSHYWICKRTIVKLIT